MNVDWRLFLNPVKDQGNCGSCVAHGVGKTWEGEIRITAEDETLDVDLSERHLFSCCGGTCDQGTTMEAGLNQGLKGVALETDCPYDARDHPCGEGLASDWWMRGKKLNDWFSVLGIDEIKKMLYNAGPLAVTMPVHQSYMNYAGGIYHNLGVFDPIIGYHCVCLAGGTDEYCIIRNSWNTDWGEQGDARMLWSELDDTAFMVVPSDEPIPEPQPTPSPCPVGNLAARMLNVVPWLLRRRGRFRYMNR